MRPVIVGLLVLALSAPLWARPVRVPVITDEALAGGRLYVRIKGQEQWQSQGFIQGTEGQIDLEDGTPCQVKVERETFWTVYSGTAEYTALAMLQPTPPVRLRASTPVFNTSNVAFNLGLPIIALLVAVPGFITWRGVRRRRQAEDAARAEHEARMAEVAMALSQARVPLPVNMEIDGYRILGLLGRGGMASVFKVTKDGQLYALKIPHVDSMDDDEFVRRFEREIRICLELRHPNIVRLDAAGHYRSPGGGSMPYMVMEMVDGVTLDSVIAVDFKAAQRPRIDFAVWVGVHVASALAKAHELGIVHRDIKPGNIMITRDQTIKVMDFGIARSTQSTRLTRTRSTIGTPVYMAPEQFFAEVAIDGRADLYALGLVLYGLLTWHLPHDDEDPHALLFKRMNEPVVPPSRLNTAVPPTLDEVVVKLLAVDVEERYQSGLEVVRALSECGISPAPLDHVTQYQSAADHIPSQTIRVEAT